MSEKKLRQPLEAFSVYHKHTPDHVDNVPNHHHPHRPDLHDATMAAPPADDAHRVENNTYNYDILNAMEYPALFGVQQTTVPPMSLFIDRVLDNVDNYALAYPMAGSSVIARPYGVQIQTDKGMFYAGKDQALGSNFFMPLGECGQGSDPVCKGKPKMVYIRNIPTGGVPLMGNASMHSVTGCNIEGVTNGKGLVPGMLEDLSDMVDVGGPNSVGERCRRVRLPVGTHIYDPAMKCELDYTKINDKQTMESKHQELLRQVRENCNNIGTNNKTWWYEEHCSPSFNNCSDVTDLKGSLENQEGVCIPKAKPSFNLPDTNNPHAPQIPSLREPEPFRSQHQSLSPPTKLTTHILLSLLLFAVVCLLWYIRMSRAI